MALGSGAKTPEELLAQPSPSRKGATLGDVKDDMFNRIREVFNLTRIVRFIGQCGAYAHHDGSSGALVEVARRQRRNGQRNRPARHGPKPQVMSKEDLPADEVAREREILSAAARQEGKPENIIAKMIEGRLKVFFSAKGAVGTAVRERRQADGGQKSRASENEDLAIRALGIGQVVGADRCAEVVIDSSDPPQ